MLMPHDFTGTSAMHVLAVSQDERAPHLLKQLLFYGGSPDTPDRFGETPLSMSLRIGTEQTALMLVKEGANIFGCDGYKRTALHHACAKNYEDLAITLRVYGASLTEMDQVCSV